MEKEVGANFLSEILRPKDEAFVISFDVDANCCRISPTHRDGCAMRSTARALMLPHPAAVDFPGLVADRCRAVPLPKGTVLYDAVYLASHDELAKEVGRKAMILLTDGEDQGSQLKITEAIEAAQKADSICYVLLIADRGFYGFGGYSGDREMKKLASETGGRVIEVGNKMDKLKDAFDQIAKELRSQYNLGYTPTNTGTGRNFPQSRDTHQQ